MSLTLVLKEQTESLKVGLALCRKRSDPDRSHFRWVYAIPVPVTPQKFCGLKSRLCFGSCGIILISLWIYRPYIIKLLQLSHAKWQSLSASEVMGRFINSLNSFVTGKAFRSFISKLGIVLTIEFILILPAILWPLTSPSRYLQHHV